MTREDLGRGPPLWAEGGRGHESCSVPVTGTSRVPTCLAWSQETQVTARRPESDSQEDVGVCVKPVRRLPELGRSNCGREDTRTPAC